MTTLKTTLSESTGQSLTDIVANIKQVAAEFRKKHPLNQLIDPNYVRERNFKKTRHLEAGIKEILTNPLTIDPGYTVWYDNTWKRYQLVARWYADWRRNDYESKD